MSTVVAGQEAPAFELCGADGKRYSLRSALAQGPVLAAFFKVSCPTCQFTFPFIERIYQQLHEKGVQIWGISQDNARDSQRFAKEFGVTFPILLDDNHYAASLDYRLTTVPTLFLIAPDGQVQISSEGFTKADFVEIQRSLALHQGTTPAALFRSNEKIPEYKPG